MSRDVPCAARRSSIFGLAALSIALAALPGAVVSVGAFAAQNTFSANALIPAGEYRGVRLNEVPQGALLEIAVETDGAIKVLLFHETEAARFPSDGISVATGAAERKISFSARAPRSGDYYIIIDNRAGELDRQVSIKPLNLLAVIDTPNPSASSLRYRQRVPSISAEFPVPYSPCVSAQGVEALSRLHIPDVDLPPTLAQNQVARNRVDHWTIECRPAQTVDDWHRNQRVVN